MIPYSRQTIDSADIDAVCDVLRSPWLTQGPAVETFEEAIADYCGAKYAIAVSSATAALHLACLALELRAPDIAWTSPNTFVASANCALYCGATVDFVDIDPQSLNLCPVALKAKLQSAARDGRLPKVITPVHFAGHSAEMESLAALARQFGVSVIEDASHALGGRYKGHAVGSCSFSDMTVFSFHAVKIITTGEGGVITTNSDELRQRLLLLRSHGITRDPAQTRRETDGPWYYEQLALGYNYRMTDIQAALGRSQLEKLNSFIARRHELANRYDEKLRSLPVTLPYRAEHTHSAFHLYVIRLRQNELKKTRRQIFEELRASGIGVNVHYIPVHLQPYYSALGFRPGAFPEAERYYKEALTIPLHAGLSESEQDEVVEALRQIVR